MSNIIGVIIIIFLIGAIFLLFIAILVFIDVRNSLDTFIRDQDSFEQDLLGAVQSLRSDFDNFRQSNYGEFYDPYFDLDLDFFEGIPIEGLPISLPAVPLTEDFEAFVPLLPESILESEEPTCLAIIDGRCCLDLLNFGEGDRCTKWQ